MILQNGIVRGGVSSMQFNSNSDFPASHLPPEQWHTVARPPPDFEPAPFIPCACLTARVLIRVTISDDSNATFNHPSIDDPLQQLPPVIVSVNGQQYSVVTAKGVLVQTMQGEGVAGSAPSSNNYNTNSNQQQSAQHDMFGASWSDSSEDESSSDDDIMMDANSTSIYSAGQQMQHPHHSHHQHHNLHKNNSHNNNKRIERAYWLRGTLRQAIYGHVRYGIILHKLDPPIRVMLPSSNEWTFVEWEATNEPVAVKEMSWEHIRYQRNRLVEDPIKEAAAMQYLKRWMEGQQEQAAQASSSTSPLINGIIPPTSASLPIPPQAMLLPPTNNIHTTSPYLIPQNMSESHIMMPLDLFTDHRNMYSIMPYCSGGELFDVLESKNRFTELEARYWMRQILRGLACLKKAGVAHRDLSLENLLVHDGNVLVIDMGMCLRVPMAENGSSNNNRRRCLILPQGVCGKWGYMSPEVCNNKLPFDGHAVDLWAAGVILFLMLTGFPPWERPVMSDERFKYMSNGYLVQMLTEWNVGLSADAMDLLQRMFWLDPLDRLSLEQVWSHPWMCATQHACIDQLGL